MNDRTHEDMHKLLREYLLETLADKKRIGVEQRLSESEEWRDALEEERELLAMLDALPDEQTDRDLAGQVLERIEAEEVPAPSRKRTIRRYAVAVSTLVLVGLAIAIVLPGLARVREAARRASSQNNLKQLGLVFKMYSNESPGEFYPPLTRYEGIWMFDIEAVYPEFMTNLDVLIDPGRADADEIAEEMQTLIAQEPVDWQRITRLAAKSYTYTGWTLQNDEDARRLAMAFAGEGIVERFADVQTPEGPLLRFREGIERFFISDINNPAASAFGQSEIAVMFETMGVPKSIKIRPGSSVLFMDGHVAFRRDNSGFPNTPVMRDTFPPQE